MTQPQASPAGTNKRIACVLAHYRSDGLLGTSTRGLLEYLVRHVEHVVLVSTNLTEEQVRSVPADADVIVRENVGYDFYSYKVGLEALGDLEAYDYVCIMNDSFVCLDPGKLMTGVLSRLDGTADVLGLTYSREIASHLQSYLLVFSRKALLSEPVRDWWASMVPISDRKTVVVQYEVGLSSFLLAQGYSLGCAFRPSPLQQLRALCHAIRLGLYKPEIPSDAKLTLDLQLSEHLNPTHFAWEELLEQFAIVKRDLFENNPYRLDLHDLKAVYGERLAAL